MDVTLCICGVSGVARDPHRDCPVHPTLLGFAVRVDRTLCGPGEVWLEAPDGSIVPIKALTSYSSDSWPT